MLNAGVDCYLDGCYAGAPSVLRAGGGLLLVSSNRQQADVSIAVQQLMADMGRVVFTAGCIGSAKALDYAIVDMYFANLVFFLNGLGLVEAEGLTPDQFVELVEFKLPTFASLLKEQLPRINRRDYKSNITATVGTWRRFFQGRHEWLESKGVSTLLPDLAVDLLNRAAGKNDAHANEDAYRLQELLRYNSIRE